MTVKKKENDLSELYSVMEKSALFVSHKEVQKFVEQTGARVNVVDDGSRSGQFGQHFGTRVLCVQQQSERRRTLHLLRLLLMTRRRAGKL